MQISNQIQYRQTSMDYRIKQITEELRSDVTRYSCVSSAARSVRMSYSYFQYLFRREMNVSFAHFLKEEKLKRASLLLETTHLSVKEITAKVGGGDENNFIRAFKLRFNITPNKYRKNVENEHF